MVPRRVANHSHVCGINRVKISIALLPYESFPRMWDQLLFSFSFYGLSRIIPTYVGSTRHTEVGHYERTNHSHVCGINLNVRTLFARLAESFPRMWDQLIECKPPDAVWRIIPTYVGSTIALAYIIHQVPNHSHVCGINSRVSFTPAFCAESFPRMWDQQ